MKLAIVLFVIEVITHTVVYKIGHWRGWEQAMFVCLRRDRDEKRAKNN